MTDTPKDTHWAREIGKFWALHDEFRVVDAAAIVAGIEPTVVDWRDPARNERLPRAAAVSSDRFGVDDEGVADINTTLLALTNAIRAGDLAATLRESLEAQSWTESALTALGGEPSAPTVETDGNPRTCWFETTVDRTSLIEWLESRPFPVPFFGMEVDSEPAYLDPSNDRYSAKLAAAVKVWEALEDEALLEGKTPKKAATEWLESRCTRLGLVWEDPKTGKRAKNSQGIDQVVAVVNWKVKGGATPTPGSD